MNEENLCEHIEGVLARYSVKWVNTEVKDGGVIVWFDVGESDPALIVKLVEQDTEGVYEREIPQVTDVKGLRFVAE